LSASAEKLANFHRNNSGMNVKVVHLDNIYTMNFLLQAGYGALNFVKYVYFNAQLLQKSKIFESFEQSLDFKIEF
jgi:hypothetical protein